MYFQTTPLLSASCLATCGVRSPTWESPWGSTRLVGVHLLRLQAPQPPRHGTAGSKFACLGPVKSFTTPPSAPLRGCCGLGSQVSPGFFEAESLCFCFVFPLLSWLLFSKVEGVETSRPRRLGPSLFRSILSTLPWHVAQTTWGCWLARLCPHWPRSPWEQRAGSCPSVHLQLLAQFGAEPVASTQEQN